MIRAKSLSSFVSYLFNLALLIEYNLELSVLDSQQKDHVIPLAINKLHFASFPKFIENLRIHLKYFFLGTSVCVFFDHLRNHFSSFVFQLLNIFYWLFDICFEFSNHFRLLVAFFVHFIRKLKNLVHSLCRVSWNLF